MKSKKQAPLKLASEDVLEALGLERRHRGRNLAAALGLAAAGFIVGVGAVLLRAGVNSLAPRRDPGTVL